MIQNLPLNGHVDIKLTQRADLIMGFNYSELL
jgi:hypothetical protein